MQWPGEKCVLELKINKLFFDSRLKQKHQGQIHRTAGAAKNHAVNLQRRLLDPRELRQQRTKHEDEIE